MAVPGNKKFSGIGKADNQAGKDDGFGDILQNFPSDDFFIPKEFAQGNHQSQHHGQTGMNGAGHKVGREYGGMPAGHNSQRKIPGHHAMDRDDQRCRQGGKEQIAAGIMPPLLMRAGPAHGEDGKYFLACSFGSVPDGRQVRQQPRIPEKAADRQIGADGNHVKHQGG